MRATTAASLSTLRADEPPGLLAVGHVAKDLQEDGFTLGGTVAYAGLTAKALGVEAAIVTSCGPDLPLGEALAGVRVHIRPSVESTTFQNIYDGSYRTQYLLSCAQTLSLRDVPMEQRATPIVLLGPVANELAPDLFTGFHSSLVGLTPQGMMRAWDVDRRVHSIRWAESDELLQDVDVVILSEDDLPDHAELDRYTQRAPIVVVTASEQGATVYDHGKARRFPGYPCDPVEPTGAGDVFAAAFLIELHRTGNLERAADFANAAASFVIEAQGATGVADRVRIEGRMSLRVGAGKRR